MRRVACLCLVLQLVAHTVVALVVHAQSQDAINSATSVVVSGLNERLKGMEGQRLDARLEVLEHDMPEVKWLVRGVTVAVLGQLMIAAFPERKTRIVKP